jgi:hypothetical protein
MGVEMTVSSRGAREAKALPLAVDTQVTTLARLLGDKRRKRGDWDEPLTALQAGADPGDFDGSGVVTGQPGRSGGEGDVSTNPDGIPRSSSAASSGAVGSTAPSERARSCWWGLGVRSEAHRRRSHD